MFFLALRHLISRRRQSILTLLGVGFGTAAFVTFSAIMTGFQDYIIDQLVNNDAHVRVSAQDELATDKQVAESLFHDSAAIFWLNGVNSRQNQSKINNPAGWFDRLKRDPDVAAFSPQLISTVIFSKMGINVGGKMTGVVASTQALVSTIENYMQFGSFKSISNPGNRIVIGQGLSDKLGARLGETLYASTGVEAATPFQVSGVFRVGVKTIDDAMAFAHINDVQQSSGRPSEISDIVIRLNDVQKAREFADRYATLAEDKILSWDESNSGILSVFSLQNFIRYFITTAILVVASFGIYNILNILVNQKRKDIGILRSMGFDRNDIVILFLTQGLILGFLGGLLGVTLGYGMGTLISQFKIGGMIDKVMVSQSLRVYIGGFLMALGSSAISSFLPARAAAQLRPIDVVRSGE